MALKSNWADGDTYTAAAANAVATTVNSLALGVGPVALQQDTTLLASSEIQTNSPLEIGSSFYLEVPATSTLEISAPRQAAGVATSLTMNADPWAPTSYESTNSTTWTDLATVTDFVTVTVGASGVLLVGYKTFANNSGTTYCGLSIALSGANTIAVGRYSCMDSMSAGYVLQFGDVVLLTNLNPGVTTIKLKYRCGGSGNASFWNRELWATPL